MKRANELIRGQDPINVSARLLEQLTPDNSHVRVSLSKQRAYLMMGDEIVIDSPISSGKRARPTPKVAFISWRRTRITNPVSTAISSTPPAELSAAGSAAGSILRRAARITLAPT